MALSIVLLIAKRSEVRWKSHLHDDLFTNYLGIHHAWNIKVSCDIGSFLIKRVLINTDVEHWDGTVSA